MAKVFRLHEEADNTIIDWTGGVNRKYGEDVINQITDPQGATFRKDITSIPSPFMRMDLAKTAFKMVGERPNKVLDGNTIWHKIISDCLDVGEIFFNYDKLADKVEIIVWDRAQEINKLETSAVKEHQIFGRTLEMYLTQDSATYNFANMDRIYILCYKGKDRKSPNDILGATSPCTMFFSSANDLSYLSEDLKSSGNDKPFDEDFTPLYKRDFEYQKSYYAIKASLGNNVFATQFPELNNYLISNYVYLTPAQKNEIDNLAVNPEISDSLPVLSVGGNIVDICGIHLRKSSGIVSPELVNSDFIISSSVYKDNPPLVLPVKAGNEYTSLKYVQEKWDKTYCAPYFDSSSLEERKLPYTQDKYPYLTIGDFLTESIISMPYELSDAFFDGNISERSRTFLLPLTETFFKFFTTEELTGNMPDGNKMFQMKCIAGGSVEVILRIPIQKGRYITYSRTYFKDKSYDEERDEGGVVEKRFGLGIMPLVRFHNVKPYYRVAFFSKSDNSSLSFLSGTEKVEPKADVIRRKPEKNCGVESYVVESAFDRINIKAGGTVNVIVPKFKDMGNASKFAFAVDFGTTNTHIEYSVDDSPVSHAFDIRKDEMQMQRMHKDYREDKDIQYAFEDAFIPDTISDGDDYSFPIRTSFAEYININYRQQTNSLANGNIPFRYEKACVPNYHKVRTDIKWSNETSPRVELYLDNLFFMMRNKVLMKGGDLGATKVVWFYPASMTKARCDKFAEIWKKLYKKYFGESVGSNLIMMSESVAPYNYFKRNTGAKSNVVTIDIGGGTTDIYVVDNNVPKMLSSFRFAANAIFGDGYNFSPATNGFVNAFKGEISSILNNNAKVGLSDVISAFEEMEKRDSSTDMIAFFFSLSNNKVIREKGIPLNFLDMLSKDDKFRYVFIIFYGAILYYVAMMLKARNLSLPQTLAFSGNGSKTLSVLSNNNETIAKFASLIFEKVMGKQYSGYKLDVIMDDEPKLATCKGGLVHKGSQNFEDIEEIRTSLLGIDDNTFTDGLKYKDINTAENINAVAENVSAFVDFLFDINTDNKQLFVNYFSADAGIMKNVRALCKDDLVEYTKQGLLKKEEELTSWGAGQETDVEETMFFYPITAMLANIARNIR